MATLDLATLRLILTTEDRKYQRGLDSAQRKSDSFGKNLGKAVGGAAVAAFGIAAAAAADFARQSQEEFKQFDNGMREVFTLLPGISGAAMAEMEDQLLDAGAEMGRLSDEMVPALYQSLSAGVPPDNVFDFLETANQAARGGVTDLTTAVDGLSSVTNAYGLDVISATEAADLMFTAVKGGKTTFDELSGSLFNVIPTAAATGVEFGNITAALAAMTAQGVPTSVATTQLRQLLVELSKSGTAASDTFQELSGKTFKDFIAEGGNLQGALQIMEQGAANLDIGLNDLFGSVEAGSAALTLTGSGTEKFTTELNNAATAAGATTEAADLMEDSIVALDGKVQAATERLKIHIGEGLHPTTRAYLELKLAVLEFLDTQTVQANTTAGLIDTFEQSNQELDDYLRQVNLSQTSQADLNRTFALGKDIVDELNRQYVVNRYNLTNVEERARITTRIIELLEEGFTGTAEELIELAQIMTVAGSDTNQFSQSLEELNRMSREAAEGFVQTEMAATDYIEVAQTLNITQEQIAEAEVRRQAATEAAAEADRLAAEAAAAETAALEAQVEALRAAGAQMGDYFSTASDVPMTNDEVVQSFYAAADSYGANAGQLAGLGLALGVFDEAAAETMMRNALLTASINEIAEAFARGELSVDEAVGAMQAAQEEIMNTDFSMDTATGTMREDFIPATDEAKQSLMDAAGEAEDLSTAIDQLPRRVDIDVYVNQHGTVQTNIPGGTGPDGGPQFSGKYGGYTGNVGINDVAGIVHGQEYVLPADVVRSVGVPALDRFADGDFSALSDGSGGGASIVMNFYGPTDPYEVENAVERALLRAGQSADTRIRTR